MDRSVITVWLKADNQRSARAREARSESAESLYEKSDQEIADAKDMFELAKAKERAQHNRRWAAIRNPREFGDKVGIGGADDLPPVSSKYALSEEALLAIAARAQAKQDDDA